MYSKLSKPMFCVLHSLWSYLWGRVSLPLARPAGGASRRLLLMGGVAFVWERERISNEDIVRYVLLMIMPGVSYCTLDSWISP